MQGGDRGAGTGGQKDKGTGGRGDRRTEGLFSLNILHIINWIKERKRRKKEKRGKKERRRKERKKNERKKKEGEEEKTETSGHKQNVSPTMGIRNRRVQSERYGVSYTLSIILCCSTAIYSLLTELQYI